MSGQDTEEEQVRLKKLITEKEDYVRALELKLTNSEFLSRAPQNVIRLTQEKKQIAFQEISSNDRNYFMKQFKNRRFAYKPTP